MGGCGPRQAAPGAVARALIAKGKAAAALRHFVTDIAGHGLADLGGGGDPLNEGAVMHEEGQRPQRDAPGEGSGIGQPVKLIHLGDFLPIRVQRRAQAGEGHGL